MRRVHTLIIGAGPAGLTAAVELARAGIRDVMVVEATDKLGGLARTEKYKGNRIDIGGNRFVSGNQWVIDWWRQIMPVTQNLDDDASSVAVGPTTKDCFGPRRPTTVVRSVDECPHNHVMFLHDGSSKFYLNGNVFDFPLKSGLDIALELGVVQCMRLIVGLLQVRLWPRSPEKTLEDFLINRFGRYLYDHFFKECAEKVLGRNCIGISAEWGAQWMRSLSMSTTILHALVFVSKSVRDRLLYLINHFFGNLVAGASPKMEMPISIINKFFYPKLGSGQMWEQAARIAQQLGVQIVLQHHVQQFRFDGKKIGAVRLHDTVSGVDHWVATEHVISTMPVRDLVAGMEDTVPVEIQKIAAALEYRDFIRIGLLYRTMTQGQWQGRIRTILERQVYIQEPGLRLGRIQVLNNFSPCMAAQSDTVWLGLEYFCQEGDALWRSHDADLCALAIQEMQSIGLASAADCLDCMVLRVPKAYPIYCGAYADFSQVRQWLDGIENLFPVGRNGMHRYINQDHAMLTAKAAVEAIKSGSTSKQGVWDVHVDNVDYKSVSHDLQEARVAASALV